MTTSQNIKYKAVFHIKGFVTWQKELAQGCPITTDRISVNKSISSSSPSPHCSEAWRLHRI